VAQLGELQGYYGEFRRAAVQVYAVGVDPPGHNARLKARLGAGYEFLSDVEGGLLDALGIRQARRSMTGKDTAIPTQYLLDREGVVRWVYRAGTWRVRPHPREALDAIRGLRDPAPAAPVEAAPTDPGEPARSGRRRVGECEDPGRQGPPPA
jgi:peroxiredoxin